MGKTKITFTDWCCGIGGTRLALEQAIRDEGYEPVCLLSSDNDKLCKQTYRANFGEEEVINGPAGVEEKIVPTHMVFSAGFPCQPFSIAGVSKKTSLGQAHGFKDKTSGTVIFELARLVEACRPEVVFLENVKNLASHDNKRTLATIIGLLREDLGYHVVAPRIFDASGLVPQHRERIFIVAFKDKKAFEKFQWPVKINKIPSPKVKDILDKQVPDKYTLQDGTWNSLKRHAAKHAAKGNGFGYGLADPNGITRTLSARYHKDGGEILIQQVNKNPRRLTPRECARLQGFPENFKIVVSDTQAYKQFGNSVPVPLLRLVARQIIKALKNK